MGRLPEAWLLLPVFLAGAALRLLGVTGVSPPGLAHDEVANWLIDRSILAGQHAVYFTEAYGHEAGFHYLQAAFVGLIGDSALALRLPAAFLGLLGIAVTYVLARQLFARRVALISAVLLAVLFYPVFFSRLGLRAIMLPVVAGLSAYFWWRGWGVETGDWRLEIRDWRLGIGDWGLGTPLHPYTSTPPHVTFYILLSGAFAGLSLHTYMAARAVPIFYALFMLGLVVLRPKMVRARWRQLALFWVALIVLASPLVITLLANPGAEFRISEIDAPLRALRQGNVRPVVDNFVDILGAFGFAGDPLWRQNVPPMPIFDPLLALFFYACLGLSSINVRDIRYLFLILWVLTATIPSIVTIDAPSSIRIINILPVLTILPAIVMHNLGHLSTKRRWLSTAPVDKWGLPILVLALVLLHVGRTAQAVFVTWPANDEVQFVWQQALTDAADYLDRSSHVHDAAVGGWTPDSMDAPTMAVTLRRDDLNLRFFDPQQSLLAPASVTGAPALIVHPAILPLDPSLEPYLRADGVERRLQDSFIQYTVLHRPDPAPQEAREVTFGQEIVFLGYTPSPSCAGQDGDAACIVVTYWRVLRQPEGDRRFFLHVVDEAGQLMGTADALGAPARFWRPGDVLLQKHTIEGAILESSDGWRLGVYNPGSGQRLPANGGKTFERLESGVSGLE